MAEYTPKQFVEMCKVLHCMSLVDFCEMYDRTVETDPGGYAHNKYTIMKKDLFLYLCELDSSNLRHVFDFCAKKYEMHLLKR
jgi:hypothetical protein